MRAVADSYDNLRTVAPKLLELELQGIASRLAEFGRRRQRDLESFRAYIEERYATFSSRPPRFPPRPDTATPTGDTGLTLDQPIVTPAGTVREPVRGGLLPQAGRRAHDRWTTLLRLADELEDTQVDQDVHVDNDPRENAGHAQWQRRPFGADPGSVEPVTSTVYMALVDDPPSLGVQRGQAAAGRAPAGRRVRGGDGAGVLRRHGRARRVRRVVPARRSRATGRSRPRTPSSPCCCWCPVCCCPGWISRRTRRCSASCACSRATSPTRR